MGFSLTIGYVMSILVSLCIFQCDAQNKLFNIMQFGARPGSSTDNSKALSSAWSEACGNNGGGVVLVPHHEFLVWPVTLSGPCNGPIELRINGILFPPAGNPFSTSDSWLSIRYVNNLVIDGGGALNGRGPTAWPCHSKARGGCTNLPITLKLVAINTATIRDITSVNSKRIHINVHGGHDITFDHVTIIAPANSPNTDGIHISKSTSVNIKNSMIGTGDDCIALGSGSKDINVTNVQCGPGHGISIGSLGQYPNEEDVTGITIRDSIFSGTTNGVRIKTWSTSISSTVSKIAYINLQMNNVKNPIVIDQNYCINGCHPHHHQKLQSMSRVQIRDVRYEGIRGTSSTKVAVTFNCSQVAPCQGLVLQDINLAFNGGGSATSMCYNARGHASGQQLPPSCL